MRRFAPPSPFSKRVFWSVSIFLLIIAWNGRARADDVAKLVQDLKRHSSYKVRLTAALVLGKRCDQRAFDALVTALKHDGNDLVRATAAAALARMGLAAAAKPLKSALRKARGQLKSRIKLALGRLCPRKLSNKRFYVNLERITYKGPSRAKTAVAMLRCRLARKLRRERDILVNWARCRKPRSRDLSRKKIRGFYLDLVLKVRHKGGMLSCKVRPTFFSYPRARLLTTGGGSRVKLQGNLSPGNLGTCLDYVVRSMTQDLVQTMHRL